MRTEGSDLVSPTSPQPRGAKCRSELEISNVYWLYMPGMALSFYPLLILTIVLLSESSYNHLNFTVRETEAQVTRLVYVGQPRTLPSWNLRFPICKIGPLI